MPALLSIERITVSLADSVAIATSTLDSDDTSNTLPMACVLPGVTNQPVDRCGVSLTFLTAPVRVQVERGDSTGALTVEIVLLKFDPAEVEVTSYDYTIDGPTGRDNVTIASVDITKAWMHLGIVGGDGTSGRSVIQQHLTTSTNAEIRVGNTGSTSTGRFYVMEDVSAGGTIWDVQQVIIGVGDFTTANSTITAVDMDKTFLHLWGRTFGTDSAPEDVMITSLTTSTNILWERNAAPGFGYVGAGAAIELLEDGSSVQRGTFGYSGSATTDTAAVTAVPMSRSFVKNPSYAGVMSSSTSGDDTFSGEAWGTVVQNSPTEIEGNVKNNSSGMEQHWELIKIAGVFAPPLMLTGPF